MGTVSDNMAMKQQDPELNLRKRRTHRAVFLDEMNLVVLWSELLSLIASHAPRAKIGRPQFELETMLRIHFVQQWSEPDSQRKAPNVSLHCIVAIRSEALVGGNGSAAASR